MSAPALRAGMPLHEASAGELLELMKSGKASAEEITRACLARARDLEPRLHAFLALDEAGALRQARSVDEARGSGRDPGPLGGVPVAIKDVIATRGLPNTCGSRILRDYTPVFDATVTERLRRAGAVILGKTNLDEFAMGSSTEHSSFGPTRTPWDTGRVPGGSSGGSAAAVAAREVPAALGSDTGGSIRQPAALSGVVGLKPTYGRVSRYGLVAYASSLDQIGPLTRTVEDSARLLAAIAGHDARDMTCSRRGAPDYVAAVERGVRGLRVGLPREYFPEGMDPGVGAAMDRCRKALERAGARCADVSMPHTSYAIAAYYVIATAEASSNLARYDGVRYGHRAAAGGSIDVGLREMYFSSRAEGFGEEVSRRILLGTFVLSAGYYEAYYGKAQRVRSLIRRDFEEAFHDCDLLLTPTSPTEAFRLGEKLEDPLEMYLTDIFTVTANLAGVPGISVPAGPGGAGLPLGCQLLGRFFEEETLLAAGRIIEEALAAEGMPARPPIG